MARKKDDYLTKEAQRIGYQKMLADIESLLQSELSEPQRIALTDQQRKIEEMLSAL